MSSPKTIWDEFKNEEFAHAYFDEQLNIFIATQLKVLREQREFTQAELAGFAHMAQERISVMENVNYSSWTISTLRRLAKALGVRLRVSFESFGSGLQEAISFTKENLKRPSLNDELEARFKPKPLSENVAMQASYSTTVPSNLPIDANSLVLIKPKIFSDPEATNEATYDRPSANAMAFSALRTQSQGASLGKEPVHGDRSALWLYRGSHAP